MGKKTFWLLLIAIHAFAGMKQLCFHTTHTRDSEEYLLAAGNLKSYGILYAGKLSEPVNERLYTKRPVAYPAILAFFELLSSGNTGLFLLLVLLAQNLLSLFNISLIVRLLLKDKQKIPWTILAVLIVLSPAQVIYANMLMSEIWLQTAIVLFCYLLISYWGNFNERIVLYLALLLVLGMLIKPVMSLLVFIFPVAFLIYSLKKKNYSLIFTALLPLCAWFAYCSWNKQRTGYSHFSSISTINLLHYNTYGVLQKTYGTAKADSITDSIIAAGRQQGSFAAQEQYIGRSCKNILYRHAGTYSLAHLKGMLLFFADPGRFDLVSFLGTGNTQTGFLEAGNTSAIGKTFREIPLWMIVCLFVIAAGNLLKTAGFILFSFKRSIPLYYRLTVAGLILYICILTGPIGASRFLMPVLPLLWLADIRLLQQYKRFQ